MAKRRTNGQFLERGHQGGQTKMQVQARQKLKTMIAGAGPKIYAVLNRALDSDDERLAFEAAKYCCDRLDGRPGSSQHISGQVAHHHEHDVSTRYTDALRELAQAARADRKAWQEDNTKTLSAMKAGKLIDITPSDALKEKYADDRREVKDGTRAAIE